MILVVGENQLQPGGLFLGQTLHNKRCGGPVVDVRSRHEHRENHPERVGDDVPLSPVYFFVSVVADLFAAARGLGTLRVDATCRRLGFAAFGFTNFHDQSRVDPVPGLIEAEPHIVVVNRPPPREVVGECPPSAAFAGDVEQRIDDEAHVVLPGAAPLAGRGNERLDEGPLGVGQTAGVRFHGSVLRNATL